MSDRDLPREQKTADDFTISLGAHRFDPAGSSGLRFDAVGPAVR